MYKADRIKIKISTSDQEDNEVDANIDEDYKDPIVEKDGEEKWYVENIISKRKINGKYEYEVK